MTQTQKFPGLGLDPIQRFLRDGYLVLPQCFEPHQIEQLRTELTPIFAAKPNNPNGAKYVEDLFCEFPQFNWILSHPPLVGALRSLLGPDYLYIHELSAHQEHWAPWHKDTTSQEKLGHSYHWDPRFLMLNVGIYFQDRSDDGGGMELVPLSHILPDLHIPHGDVNPYQINVVSPDTRVGDVLLFHVRISHRAIPKRRELPRPKQAIYLTCSVNNELARTYTEHTVVRKEYTVGHDWHPELRALESQQPWGLA